MRTLLFLEILISFMLFIPDGGLCASCSVPGHVLSHYALDSSGTFMRNGEGSLIYKEGVYEKIYTFSSSDTAFVVMDPWINQTPQMDAIVFPIYEKYILPLIKAARNAGFRVYVFTDLPENLDRARDERGRPTRDNPKVMELIDGEKVIKRLHQSYASSDFSNELKRERERERVKNLIYLGFASNWCVPFRDLGMFSMRKAGFTCFFVPEASAAVEIGDGWASRELDAAMRKILAMQRFPLLNGDNLLDCLKKADIGQNE